MLGIFFIICLIAIILAFYFSNNHKNINPKQKKEIYFDNADSLNITGIYHCIILGNYPLKSQMNNEFIFTDGNKFYQSEMTDKEYKILFSLIKKSKEIK